MYYDKWKVDVVAATNYFSGCYISWYERSKRVGWTLGDVNWVWCLLCRTDNAVYDHENNIGYQPYGSCLPCHSEEYWSNFRQGYDQQWNTLQGQSTDQGSSINIYGNNNYVSTNQYSNQQQNPLQQLAHTVCGWINGNQPLQPQQRSWGP